MLHVIIGGLAKKQGGFFFVDFLVINAFIGIKDIHDFLTFILSGHAKQKTIVCQKNKWVSLGLLWEIEKPRISPFLVA